jgi:hypothetical protein
MVGNGQLEKKGIGIEKVEKRWSMISLFLKLFYYFLMFFEQL